MSSARLTLEKLANKNNVNRKLVFNIFLRDVMIKLFNVVILEIVESYLMSLIVLCFVLFIV